MSAEGASSGGNSGGCGGSVVLVRTWLLKADSCDGSATHAFFTVVRGPHCAGRARPRAPSATQSRISASTAQARSRATRAISRETC